MILILSMLKIGYSIEDESLKLKNELKFGEYTNILIDNNNIEKEYNNPLQSIFINIKTPFCIIILQMIVIIVLAKTFGFLCGKIGQPSAIGEIMAGIILGPSALGMLFPNFMAFLFPQNSYNSLQILSQIGLILFMFILGMELDISIIKKNPIGTIFISNISILFPFLLGVILAFFIYKKCAPSNNTFIAFALFMGISMSITAFPVLAAILREKRLTNTTIGTLTIACASIGDISAWCILALVVAISSSGAIISAFTTILLSAIFILLMLFFVRPIIRKLESKINIKILIFSLEITILLMSSYITEVIGIHALFGAFLAGIVMPKNVIFRKETIAKIEDLSVVMLLPLFFASSGLRTQIGLLNQTYLWGICFLIIITAIIGKFIGSALSARFIGQTWKNALSIGVLMNTRGLMELVVINIGYDLGILSPEMFTIMLIMALFTTIITSPSLNLINYIFSKREKKNTLNNIECKYTSRYTNQ